MELNKTAKNRLVRASRKIGEGFYDRDGALSELDSDLPPQYDAEKQKE